MPLSDERKKEIVDRIMGDVEGNLLNYQNFVLNCVRDTVKNWDDEDLLNWINEKG